MASFVDHAAFLRQLDIHFLDLIFLGGLSYHVPRLRGSHFFKVPKLMNPHSDF